MLGGREVELRGGRVLEATCPRLMSSISREVFMTAARAAPVGTESVNVAPVTTPLVKMPARTSRSVAVRKWCEWKRSSGAGNNLFQHVTTLHDGVPLVFRPGYSSAANSPLVGPAYRLSGRISELAAVCSMTCAVQPMIRLITKIGVNIAMSKPIR